MGPLGNLGGLGFGDGAVSTCLSELLEKDVAMAPDCVGDGVASCVDTMSDGDVLLLENVRFYKEETKNDPDFAKKLAANADLFVNDAFGTAHRAHGSTAGVTEYLSPSVAGFLSQEELEHSRGPQGPLPIVQGTHLLFDVAAILAKGSVTSMRFPSKKEITRYSKK